LARYEDSLRAALRSCQGASAPPRVRGGPDHVTARARRGRFDTFRFAHYKEKVIDPLPRVTRGGVETVAIVGAMRRLPAVDSMRHPAQGCVTMER